ncbi:MAG: hypothetical protein U1D30_15810 [Planctomycetota bacterium]
MRYEDLQFRDGTFQELCRRLAVQPRNNLFWQSDQHKGRKALPLDLQEYIDQQTAGLLAELRSHRVQPLPQTQSWRNMAQSMPRN